MRRTWIVAITLGGLLGLGGCSDDTKPKTDGPKKDQRLGDLGPLADLPPGTDLKKGDTLKPDKIPGTSKMGEGCQYNTDCGADAPLCLMPSGTTFGICSAECTPDDPSTPLINEDSCSTGAFCATFRYTTKDYNYCLKKCTPSLTTTGCPASSKRACHPASTYYGDLDQPVCWYLACVNDKDCPVSAEKKCVSDTECTSVGTDAFCNTDEGQCARPGKCTPGGICGPHTMGKATSKVGDPCKSDFDCPNSGSCMPEGSDTGAIGVSYRNGYCMIANCSFAKQLPEFACPTGSLCNNLFYGGRCNKSCDMTKAADCRGYALDRGGDYECYAWNNLVIGSTPISEGPVCAAAASQSCTDLGTKLTCASLGDEKGNPTKMGCRDRFTGVVKSNAADPTGVCLDDTASGVFDTPLPPDAAVPDMKNIDAGTKVDAPVTKVDAPVTKVDAPVTKIDAQTKVDVPAAADVKITQ